MAIGRGSSLLASSRIARAASIALIHFSLADFIFVFIERSRTGCGRQRQRAARRIGEQTRGDADHAGLRQNQSVEREAATETKSFVIKDNGGAALSVTVAPAAGSEFFHIVSGQGATLIEPHGESTVTVEFAPTNGGTDFSAKIAITSDATKGTPSAKVKVTGTAKKKKKKPTPTPTPTPATPPRPPTA